MNRLTALLIALVAVSFGTGWLFKDQDLVLKAKLVFASVAGGTVSGSTIQVQPNLSQTLMFQDTLGNNILGITSTSGAPAILQYYPETLSGVTGVVAAGTGQTTATPICTTTEMALISGGAALTSTTLPNTPYSGQHCMVKNKSGNAQWLWGGSGGTLCVSGSACGSAGASGSLANNVQLDCYADPPGGASPVWECR